MKKLLFLIILLYPFTAFADRLWSTGAELQSTDGLNPTGEWDALTGANIFESTTSPRTGAACVAVSQAGSNAINTLTKTIYNSVVANDDCFRAYLRIGTSVGALTGIIQFQSSASVAKASIRLATDDTLEVWDDVSGKIGSSSSALSKNTYYRVELCATYSVGTITGYLDGSQIASGGNSTFSTTNAKLIIGSVASTTGAYKFDDMAWNSSAGSSQTGLPGAGSIVYVRPNATGDNGDGTPTGAATGWQCTDEVTPNQSTDYQSFTVNNQILDVNMQSSATAGIGSGDTITLVQVGVSERPESASSNSWNLRIKSQASGTTVDGATTSHDDASFKTNGDVAPTLYTLTSYVDPQAGGAWTPGLIDTMQIGFKITTKAVNERLTALWALVEFVPAAATATPTATATATATNTPTVTSTPTVTPTPLAVSIRLLPMTGVGK